MHRAIRFVTFRSGERYPVLLGEDRVPLWYPTLYCTTRRRNASLAASTLQDDLSHIRLLLEWADVAEVDFAARLLEGPNDLLNTQEIESLVEALGRRRPSRFVASKVVDLDKRRATRANNKPVDLGVKYNRISVAADYLEWLLPRMAIDLRSERSQVQDQARRIATLLRKLRPMRSGFSRLNMRKGLSDEALSRVLEIIKFNSADNPFKLELRRRNSLVIRILLELGLRRGELLSIKITDIDFKKNEILIPRRADDHTDPRKDQPVAKTADRRLPISEELASEIWEYIAKDRKPFPKARKHAFLLVVHADGDFKGQPISKKSLDKIFKAIRKVDPKLASNLVSHVLRHTSNDQFSAASDLANTKPADEERQRSYKYGWKYGSGTAATYTKRHIERKAQIASLKLQNHIRNKFT